MKKTTINIIETILFYVALVCLVLALIVAIIMVISIEVPEMDYGVFDWIITPIIQHGTFLTAGPALVGAILTIVCSRLRAKASPYI